MQFVNKDFLGKNQCIVLLQRRMARIDKSTKVVSHESLRLCYTVITQPVQDTVVLNIKKIKKRLLVLGFRPRDLVPKTPSCFHLFNTGTWKVAKGSWAQISYCI